MKEAAEKLKALGYTRDSPIFSAVLDIIATISLHDLSSKDEKDVLNLITSQEFEDFPLLDDTSWVEFDYGNVKPGDYVRIKKDSYDSETGREHNGRVGRLVNLSGRRATVRYLGIKGISPMRHPIGNLQSLKFGVRIEDRLSKGEDK